MANYMQVALTCPDCKKKSAFCFTKMVNYKGEVMGLMGVKCEDCEWELSDEEIIRDFEKWWKENDEQNRSQ